MSAGTFTQTDGQYLQQAIAWSRAARERGNRPFGAVVVSVAPPDHLHRPGDGARGECAPRWVLEIIKMPLTNPYWVY